VHITLKPCPFTFLCNLALQNKQGEKPPKEGGKNKENSNKGNNSNKNSNKKPGKQAAEIGGILSNCSDP
jgi:hypothetical protein